MRAAKIIKLNALEDVKLVKLSKGRRTAVRLAERAKIVLLAAEGKDNQEIGEVLGITRQKAGRWRLRYWESGLAGIEKDAPRPGRHPKYDESVIEEVVRKTLHEKPSNATHWSRSTMAKASGLSDSTIGKIWKRHGLKPHLVNQFKLSNDKNFIEKLEDIVGL